VRGDLEAYGNRTEQDLPLISNQTESGEGSCWP